MAMVQRLRARIRVPADLLIPGPKQTRRTEQASRDLRGCAYRKSHPAISMVQSTEDRAADDMTITLFSRLDSVALFVKTMQNAEPKHHGLRGVHFL